MGNFQNHEPEIVPVDLDNLLEIELNDEEDFLKIRETLTRIGVASRKDKTIYQSCHILHKRGKYYIVHFKELFALGYVAGYAMSQVFNEKRRRKINGKVGRLFDFD